MTQKTPDITVRWATENDLDAVEKLDETSFPVSDPEAERAAPGELLAGIQKHELLVAEESLGAKDKRTRIVGYLQYSTLRKRHKYFLAGVAVEPAYRRQGIGALMTAEFLRLLRRETLGAPMITCTTNPKNIAAISTFLRNGFVVSRYIPEFFGKSKDRLYLEWGIKRKMASSGHSVLVPVENLAYLSSILDEVGFFVTDIVNMPHGMYFQVDELRESKQEELDSNETSVSSNFTGILLSATAFLLEPVRDLRSIGGRIGVWLLALPILPMLEPVMNLISRWRTAQECTISQARTRCPAFG